VSVSDPFLHLRATSRALVLASGAEEAPVGIWGTCFVGGYAGRLFVITASHLTGPNHSSELAVLPSDGSNTRFRLSNGIGIWPPDQPPDHIDVIVYPASLSDLDSRAMRTGRVMLLGGEIVNWEPRAPVSQFCVIGYPRELNEVDFESGTVHTAQAVLTGRYQGAARADGHVHAMRIDDAPQLGSYAGFSGSPIICLQAQIAREPEVRFAGIAISGTVTSGLVHFVDAAAVEMVLRTAVEHAEGRLPLAVRAPPPGQLGK
jgi:hypothetical protein